MDVCPKLYKTMGNMVKNNRWIQMVYLPQLPPCSPSKAFFMFRQPATAEKYRKMASSSHVGPAPIPNVQAPELIHGNVHPRTRFSPNFPDLFGVGSISASICGR